MNPYDFVRIDWSREPERRPFTPHDRFTGWTGHIEGVVTAESPLFIPDKRSVNPKKFQTNGHGQPILPGSSLKGLFRSLVETVAPGCWCLFDGQYRDDVDYTRNLPRAFHQCNSDRALCPACRMFGLIHGKSVHLLGRVGFDDAVCSLRRDHEAVYTPILDGPKPRHSAWYLDPAGKWVAGRKFYFHQRRIRTEREQKISRARQHPLNEHITPLDKGSAFLLSVHFTDLFDAELPLLLYALILEPGMRHKLGYAKPAGLGSIRVNLTRLTRQDMATRYTGGTPEVYEGQALEKLVSEQTASFAANSSSVTLQDLRRIWGWPPTGTHRYPSSEWFGRPENRGVPIAETP